MTSRERVPASLSLAVTSSNGTCPVIAKFIGVEFLSAPIPKDDAIKTYMKRA